MRANTKKKHEMGKRFTLLIGLAAVGVMALGAQTASSTTGDPVDSTPPDLKVSGPKKQNPQKPIGPEENACPPEGDGWRACMLKVRTSCGEACTIWATGKLTNVKMDKLGATGCVCSGGKFPLGPELRNEKQREQVRQALDNGENVQAKVTVTAKDAAGNVATAKRTITLVKCGATSGPNCSAK